MERAEIAGHLIWYSTEGRGTSYPLENGSSYISYGSFQTYGYGATALQMGLRRRGLDSALSRSSID